VPNAAESTDKFQSAPVLKKRNLKRLNNNEIQTLFELNENHPIGLFLELIIHIIV
jgi:formate dehydrogenase maturation protein FdhE